MIDLLTPDADLSPAQSAVMIAMAAIALAIALYILAFAELDHRRAFARPATRRRADEAWRRAFFALPLPPPNYAPPAAAGRRPVPARNAPGSCRRPLLTQVARAAAVAGLALLLTGCADGDGRRIGVMLVSAAVAVFFFAAFAGTVAVAMRPDGDPLDDIIGDVPAPQPRPRDEGEAP